MADEDKIEKPKKFKLGFADFDKKELDSIKDGDDKEFVYIFKCKSAFTVTQKIGPLNVKVVEDNGGKVFITASKGEVNMMSADGQTDDKKLDFQCDPKELKVQGCCPAFGGVPVKSINPQAVGCVHQPGNLFCKGQAQYNSTSVPPVPTVAPAISMVTLPQLNVKLEDGKAKIVKKDDLQVKRTGCKGDPLAVVGDKIEIEHKFKQDSDVVPPMQAQLKTLPTTGAPWPAMMPIQSQNTEGKPQDMNVMANAAGVVPAWLTFMPMSATEFYMLSDAIAGSKVVVDNAITDQGASTSVFCEGKAVALQGNNNICYNDSITRQQCLIIDQKK